jgi:large subunit ribosomal protein L14e
MDIERFKMKYATLYRLTKTLSTPHGGCSSLQLSCSPLYCAIQASTMPFHRYVEVGRIVLINYGPEKGKLAAIIDIVDQNKCLIDGPCSGVTRQVIALTRVALTDFTIKIQRSARQKTILKAWAEGEIDAKWAATSWAKKLSSRTKRANLNDFDRFKVMVAKKQKTEIINKKLASM